MLRVGTFTQTVQESFKTQANAGYRQLLSRKDVGFFDVVNRNEIWMASQERGQEIRTQATTLGVIGIGGSSLGLKAIMGALSRDSKKVVLFENVDPISFENQLRAMGSFEKCHWLVISKSGKTLETLVQLNLVVSLLKPTMRNWNSHFTVVTDPGSNPLRDWATQNHVKCLDVPTDVGGRFSVLTPVGLLPAAFLNYDLNAMREGARFALQSSDAIIETCAQVLASWERKEWVTIFWSYSDLLSQLGFWVQQLWAESLAKSENRKGQKGPRVSVPLPLIGANDQHSVLQQVADGDKSKFVVFLQIKALENIGRKLEGDLIGLPSFMKGKQLGQILGAERAATQEALRQKNVNSMLLSLDDMNEYNLAALFMYFQMVVATLGECLDINSFDQPGVELGKRLALDSLSNIK